MKILFKSRYLLSGSAIRLVKFAIPALAIISCTERIDLELDSTFTRLVVEGNITSDPGVQRIKLTTTTDFYYKGQPPAVSNAMAKITDGSNSYNLTESPAGSGIYETASNVKGIPGRTYTLQIELAGDIGGHKSFTASCFLKPIGEPDSIQVVFQPSWGPGFWEVKLYAKDPPTADFYQFMLYRNRMLLTDSLHKIFVIDDRLFNGNYTFGVGVGFLDSRNPREALLPGDTVTLMTTNLTESHARFIWAARSERFNSPLFSGPPANVPGNISNGAIGFFGAYQPRYTSVIYR